MAARPADRLERITNLVLVLLATSRPLSLREIGATVAGYPSAQGALRQAFERDKRTLRDGGIPVTAVPIGGEDQFGYRILPEHYYLPDLALTEEEEAALAFAVAAVRLDGGASDDALAKLGLSGPEGLRPLAQLPALPALPALHEALRRRRLVSFGYHGRQRLVEPAGLVFRLGSWYFVGADRRAEPPGAWRTFRVDRIETPPELGEEELPAEAAPVDLAAVLGWPSQRQGRSASEGGGVPGSLAPGRFAPAAEDEASTVVIEVSAGEAARAIGALGAGAVEERRADGSARLRCLVGDEAAFARFVAGFGSAAEVLAPELLRERVVALLARRHAELLAAAAPAPADPATPAAAPAPADPATPAAAALAAHSGARVRPGDAGARLRRLLAVLAYLARTGSASLDDLAERFGVERAELVTELELAACCGLPPYTPDQLLELVVDGERVEAFGLEPLRRPRRLTSGEGFAVAAAARALLAVPGADHDGPLAGALGKLEAVLGSARIDIDLPQPPLLAQLRRAAASGEVVRIDYPSRAGAVSVRRLEPYTVVVREGRWYLDGWADPPGNWRRFAVDRVLALAETGERVAAGRTPPAGFDGARAYVGSEHARKAIVELAATDAAALDRVGADLGAASGDRRVVALEVSDELWLARLLLPIDGAVVREPAALALAVAGEAASALARYRPG